MIENRHIRFLTARRILQGSIVFLFIAGNVWGWSLLKGDLSTAKVMNVIPLSDPFAVLQMIVSGASLATDVLIGALLIVLIYGLFAGRMFCSWVCPVNIVTDTANWLRRKIFTGSRQKLVRVGRNTRFGIIAVALVLSVMLSVPAFEMVSPISLIHRGLIFGFGLGWTMIVVIFLWDLLVLPNGFCGHLCPLGGFYSLLNRFSLVRVRHDHVNCTNCMDCKVICPEKPVLKNIGIESGFINGITCTNCGRCIEVCKDDALEFGIRQIIRRQEK